MDCFSGAKSSGVKIPPQSDLREEVSAWTIYRKFTIRRKNKRRNESFTCATWNIRTLTDSKVTDRLERRSAIIAHELERLNIDLVALSATRLLDEGSLVDGNYKFFWKGLPNGSRKIHGVGFAIRNSLLPRLNELPHGISERPITLKYQLSDEFKVHVISAYAPTLDADQQTNQDLYFLHKVLISSLLNHYQKY